MHAHTQTHTDSLLQVHKIHKTLEELQIPRLTDTFFRIALPCSLVTMYVTDVSEKTAAFTVMLMSVNIYYVTRRHMPEVTLLLP
jgi:hypothetical protein